MVNSPTPKWDPIGVDPRPSVSKLRHGKTQEVRKEKALGADHAISGPSVSSPFWPRGIPQVTPSELCAALAKLKFWKPLAKTEGSPLQKKETAARQFPMLYWQMVLRQFDFTAPNQVVVERSCGPCEYPLGIF